MSNPIDNGGPAFPLNSAVIGDLEGMGRDEQLTVEPILHHPGMTLRDWFAGMAMNGILSSSNTLDGKYEKTPETVAWSAFAMADAMLAQRNKPVQRYKPAP